jgi:hypothetical protein
VPLAGSRRERIRIRKDCIQGGRLSDELAF